MWGYRNPWHTSYLSFSAISKGVHFLPAAAILWVQSFCAYIHQILHTWFRTKRRAPRNSSDTHQRRYLGNNALSHYLVSTLMSNWWPVLFNPLNNLCGTKNNTWQKWRQPLSLWRPYPYCKSGNFCVCNCLCFSGLWLFCLFLNLFFSAIPHRPTHKINTFVHF